LAIESPHPRVPFKKAIGFSFFSFPSNSLGYRIFHFSFFSFPSNSLGYRIFHFSFFSFPSNSLGYRIFHFSFFSFHLMGRQPFFYR
ncbi:MAG: hypothetical protein MR613_02645, partial [Prevotella sp.]|nr:hypothetical protein [Prevotella sp.]